MRIGGRVEDGLRDWLIDSPDKTQAPAVRLLWLSLLAPCQFLQTVCGGAGHSESGGWNSLMVEMPLPAFSCGLHPGYSFSIVSIHFHNASGARI